MVRLNILKERQSCGCGGNCQCGKKKTKKPKKTMNDFFSSMRRNTEE